MTRGVYYNEFDPKAAAWLRALIARGLIPAGEVDERSIADVAAEDLRGFTQHHFFAGIAGWSRALELAGWPADRPVWTGSCPCQPFSVAGKGKGTADERHVWPDFFRLISECRPPVVIGEQVASKAGREWLAGVLVDLEGVGYAGAGADLCAAGVGAPHIRQRIYWVGLANASCDRQRLGAERDGKQIKSRQQTSFRDNLDGRSYSGGMANADSPEWRAVSEGRRHDDDRQNAGREEAASRHQFHRAGDVADANDEGRQGRAILPECADECSAWSDGVEWRRGADGKQRRVKSGVRLLVDGVPNRVGRLRGFGNAIVPPLAAEVIRALMDIVDH